MERHVHPAMYVCSYVYMGVFVCKYMRHSAIFTCVVCAVKHIHMYMYVCMYVCNNAYLHCSRRFDNLQRIQRRTFVEHVFNVIDLQKNTQQILSVYMYMHTCMYTRTYAHMQTHTHTHTHTYVLCGFQHQSTCICMHICIYVYICMFLYIYKCIHRGCKHQRPLSF